MISSRHTIKRADPSNLLTIFERVELMGDNEVLLPRLKELRFTNDEYYGRLGSIYASIYSRLAVVCHDIVWDILTTHLLGSSDLMDSKITTSTGLS